MSDLSMHEALQRRYGAEVLRQHFQYRLVRQRLMRATRAITQKIADKAAEIEAFVREVPAAVIADDQPERPAPRQGPARDIPPPTRRILRVVAADYGVSVVDLISARRQSDVIAPRHVAMWLCKTMTLNSLPMIGRHFGGRDHTTVLHAVRRIEALRLASPTFAAQLEELQERIMLP